VGIEAISRGAKMVYFVERSTSAAGIIGDNLRSLRAESSGQILTSDAVRALHGLSSRGVTPDVIFLDPPYQMTSAYAEVLRCIASSTMVTRETSIIAEHLRQFDLGEQIGRLKRIRKLIQGDAALSFYAAQESSERDCATLAR
jgi:16S rRNA (guanine(966)-N(2))-methyltransferase RsmD